MLNSKSFVIFFFERSGSTLLVDLLNQHPQISCKHEVFHMDWKNFDRSTMKNPVPIHKTHEEVKQKFREVYESNQVNGFKFKYPNQLKNYPWVLNQLIRDKEEVKVIFLYRVNRLKGAISSQNNVRLRKLNYDSNVTEKVDLPPLKLNVDRARKYIFQRQKADRKHFEELAIFPNRYVISYEDLVGNLDERIKDIYSFLGADSKFKPQMRYQKITNDNLQLSLENYKEVKESLRCTSLEKYLY